jgi:lysophosphatidylcholine acyltransferase / lyso-PAF acetyltransferase
VNELKARSSNIDYPQILIFPEGTTTNGSALISFKNGAFYPSKPVQPFVVRLPNENYDLSW